MTEFQLQDVAPQIYERGEVRAWPLKTRSVFNVAPHIVAKNKNHFANQDALLGEYRSSVWYQLQMTLNAGQKEPTAEHPVDWPYQQRHVRELAERSEVWDGLRHTATNIKAYQERDNGNGPVRRGWELRVTHPHWLYSNPNGDTRLMESLDQVEGGLKNRIVNSMLREFLERVNGPGFEPERWDRCGHSEEIKSTERWACVEPEDYVPVAYGGSGKIFFFPENYHADNFYRLVPLLQESGVDIQVMNDLIDWYKTMWPRGDWDQYRQATPLTTSVVLPAEDFTSEAAQTDEPDNAWDIFNRYPDYQDRGYVATPTNTGQPKSGGFDHGARLNYAFTLPQDDTYHLWVRRFARSLGSNSAYFGLDGVPLDSVDNGQGVFYRWHWVKLASPELKAGEHTLELVRRENGYLVDAFMLTTTDQDPNQADNARQGPVADKPKISQTTTAELRLFPNPVADQRLHVSTSEADVLRQVVLLDAKGRKLLQRPADGQAQLSLDMSQLPPGLYVVKAYGLQQTWTDKIIIE